MSLTVLTVPECPLGELLAEELGCRSAEVEVAVLPDGELDIVVPDLRNADTVVVLSTSPPVNEKLMQLALTLDACRRGGATRVTAVVPYFGYARQDRSSEGGPLGARVAASMIGERADRVIVVDPHSTALEGMLSVPLSIVSGLPALASALEARLPDNAVIVAPDIGAAKLAERFSERLKLPYAVVHKTRVSGTDVHAGAVVGDVEGRVPVVVDDMISTGGTVAAAFHALRSAGSEDSLSLVITHALFRELSEFRLKALPLRDVFVTNTIEKPNVSFPIHVVSVAPDMARVVRGFVG